MIKDPSPSLVSNSYSTATFDAFCFDPNLNFDPTFSPTLTFTYALGDPTLTLTPTY